MSVPLTPSLRIDRSDFELSFIHNLDPRSEVPDTSVVLKHEVFIFYYLGFNTFVEKVSTFQNSLEP